MLLVIGIVIATQPVGYGCTTLGPDDTCPVPVGVVLRGISLVVFIIVGSLLVGGWVGWTLQARWRMGATSSSSAIRVLRRFGLLVVGVLLLVFGVLWASRPVEYLCGGIGTPVACGPPIGIVVKDIGAGALMAVGVMVIAGWVAWHLRKLLRSRRTTLGSAS